MDGHISRIAGRSYYLEQTTIELRLENILYQEIVVVIVEWLYFQSGCKVGFYGNKFYYNPLYFGQDKHTLWTRSG